MMQIMNSGNQPAVAGLQVDRDDHVMETGEIRRESTGRVLRINAMFRSADWWRPMEVLRHFRMIWLLLGLMVPALLTSTAAMASNDVKTEIPPAKAFLADFTERGLNILRSSAWNDVQKREKLHELVDEGFYVDGIARYILGNHWDKLSPVEQKQYRDLYLKYMVNTYIQRLIEIRDQKLQITGGRPYGEGDVVIESSIENEKTDGPFDVRWRVRAIEKAKGKGMDYRIVDIILKGGYSLALTQREEFGSILGKQGFDELMVLMDAKIDKALASLAARTKTWQ